MTELLTAILPIAVVDSMSITPLGLVPLATLLAGRRPFAGAAAFLCGLFVSYYAMAMASLLGLAAVFARLNAWAAHRWQHPEPVDFLFECVIGALLVIAGVRTARRRTARSSGREVATDASPAAAFGFACMLNVVGFPGALPWFAAADQILRVDATLPRQALAVFVYVTVFVLPLTIVVVARALLGRRGDAFIAAAQRFFATWGRRALIAFLLLLGVAMTLDGIVYFVRGAPLVPIGFPAV